MRLFLWDIDGTLVATGGVGMRALDRAFAEHFGVAGAARGVEPDGKTDPMLVEEMSRAALGRAPTAADIDSVLGRYVAHLADEVARTERYRIFPGVVDALDLCAARGFAVGLATGNVERGAEIKLTRGDLWRRFAFGGYGSDAADRAELVAHAIARGERHAGRAFGGRTFVVGDTPRDVAAAHACQAVAVAVATGRHGAAELAAVGADVVLTTLEEFPAWLARM